MPSLARSVFLATCATAATLVRCDPTKEPSDSKVVQLTDKTFNNFIRKNELVIMEFYAPWCGHCQQMAKPFREAAAQMDKLDLPKKVKFAKMDDSNEENRRLRAGAPDMYNYSSYPTLMVFHGDPAPGIQKDPDGEKWWERKDKTWEWYGGGRDKPEDFVFWMSALAKDLDPREEEKNAKPGLYRTMTTLMWDLDPSNFNKTVLNEATANNRVWIIEFYSDHCHLCKGLKKDFIEAAKRGYKANPGKVRFGAVNTRVFQDIADTWEITSYPWVTSIYEGKKLEDMAGLGGADSIVDWAARKVSESWKPSEGAESGFFCDTLGDGLKAADVAVGDTLVVASSEPDVKACVAEKGKEWFGKTARKRAPVLGKAGVIKEIDAEKGLVQLTIGAKDMWWGLEYLRRDQSDKVKEEL